MADPRCNGPVCVGLELHRLDQERILRYDLCVPLLLAVRYEGRPLRIWTAGKAYRLCQVDAARLDSFHLDDIRKIEMASVT